MKWVSDTIRDPSSYFCFHLPFLPVDFCLYVYCLLVSGWPLYLLALYLCSRKQRGRSGKSRARQIYLIRKTWIFLGTSVADFSLSQTVTQDHCQLHGKIENWIFLAVANKTESCEEERRLDREPRHKRVYILPLIASWLRYKIPRRSHISSIFYETALHRLYALCGLRPWWPSVSPLNVAS